MAIFEPNRTLLSPKFEGYKLDIVRQEDVVKRHDLEYKLTQATVSGKSPLSFQEVQSRITHNHLAVAAEGSRALYVDAEHKVILIEFAEDSRTPSFRIAYELPKPVSAPTVASLNFEYPSSAFLDHNAVFVADGHGALYIFNLAAAGTAELVGCYELSTPESNMAIPFRLHSVVNTSETAAVALLSSRFYDDKNGEPLAQSGKHMGKSRAARFDIWAVQFTLPFSQAHNEVGGLNVIWRRRGDDVPIYTSYDHLRSLHILLGSSMYHDINVPSTPTYEPSPDEIAPIPRADETLDNDEAQQAKPPPYSWTQTSDSVTIAFPLPSATPKSDIKVSFTSRTLTLHVQATTSSVSLPHYSLKQLWDGVLPSTSFWTWDREGEHSYGLLTLHLDKQHEGTRWVQVFASASTYNTGEEEEDVEVPETLDPSELYTIRETLEKYTSSLQTGEDTSGLGLGRGVPSLAEGEMDDEVDTSIGRVASLTWVTEDGSSPTWLTAQFGTPFNVLSIALPGPRAQPSLVLKQGLDGTLFSLDSPIGISSSPEWTHDGTFSALAFVLASKRDTRFTYHVSSKAVLAFESGSGGRGSNVYVYRRAAPNQLWAKQSILKLSDGTAGSLLGVGAWQTAQGKHVILCLCESRLVVIHEIL